MTKELKNIIRLYVEKVGYKVATESSMSGMQSLLKNIKKDKEPTLENITACKLKFSIIEYLYFHYDTEKEAIKLLKKIIDDN